MAFALRLHKIQSSIPTDSGSGARLIIRKKWSGSQQSRLQALRAFGWGSDTLTGVYSIFLKAMHIKHFVCTFRPSGYWLAVLQRFLFGHCCLGDCHSRLGRLAQAPISMNLNLDEQPMNWALDVCSAVTCSSDFSITFCLFAWQNGMMVACGVLLAITTMCCFCMNFRRPVLVMFELPTYFGLAGLQGLLKLPEQCIRQRFQLHVQIRASVVLL